MTKALCAGVLCVSLADRVSPLSGSSGQPLRGTARDGNRSMALLDAGDYDNDGSSELIFFLSQPEDTDGFVLFDGRSRKQASLTWTYH
jgi:hypothetical protein